MSRWRIGAAIVALGCLPAAVALATTQFTQTSKITLTAHKAGASTGIRADVKSADRGAPGGKPKAAKSLLVTFPRGTTFNFGKIKACTLSDTQLTTLGGSTCPASSQIGTGSAVANAAPLPIGSIRAKVAAYVRNPRTVILRITSTVAPPIVIHQTVKGSTFTIPIPTSSVGKPPVTVVLTELALSIPARGAGAQALIRAGKCTAGAFVVKSHFVYADHSTFDTKSTSKCS